MPAPLVKAHERLDRTVEACYSSKRFHGDRQQFEALIARYEHLTLPRTGSGIRRTRPSRPPIEENARHLIPLFDSLAEKADEEE
jgi:hypothetical protein